MLLNRFTVDTERRVRFAREAIRRYDPNGTKLEIRNGNELHWKEYATRHDLGKFWRIYDKLEKEEEETNRLEAVRLLEFLLTSYFFLDHDGRLIWGVKEDSNIDDADLLAYMKRNNITLK